MALLQNITLNAQYPVSFSGGATGNERSQFGQRLLTHFNKYAGDAGMDPEAGVPEGYQPPYSWGLPIDAATVATVTVTLGVALLLLNAKTPSFIVGWMPTNSTPNTIDRIEWVARAPSATWTAKAPRATFAAED